VASFAGLRLAALLTHRASTGAGERP
jgi:hypothetical protein